MARCVQGDARREDAYEAALAGEIADALITDPPYCLLTRRRKRGDLRDPHAGRKIDREPVLRFESVRDYRDFAEQWLPHAVSHLRSGAPLAIWTNFLGKEPTSSVAKDLGYQVAGEFVWAKRTTERDGSPRPLRCCRGREDAHDDRRHVERVRELRLPVAALRRRRQRLHGHLGRHDGEPRRRRR